MRKISKKSSLKRRNNRKKGGFKMNLPSAYFNSGASETYTEVPILNPMNKSVSYGHLHTREYEIL